MSSYFAPVPWRYSSLRRARPGGGEYAQGALRLLFVCKTTGFCHHRAHSGKLMRNFLLPACIIATAAFTFTAFFGFASTLRASSVAGYGLCLACAAMVLALLLSTKDLWTHSGALYYVIRCFWVICVITSIYTLYIALCKHLIVSKSLFDNSDIDWEIVHAASMTQWITTCISLVFMMAGPIGFSFIRHEETD